jgi:hypothetical protein
LVAIDCSFIWTTRCVRIGTNPWAFRRKVNSESYSSLLVTGYLTDWLLLRGICKIANEKWGNHGGERPGSELTEVWEHPNSDVLQLVFSESTSGLDYGIAHRAGYCVNLK